MISEVKFASDYGSFWRSVTPMMDGFVRRLNSSGYERDFPPIESETAPNRRSTINQIAFAALCAVIDQGFTFTSAIVRAELIDAAQRAILGLESFASEDDGALTALERRDATLQLERLQVRIISPHAIASLTPRPTFPGCGFLDACEGDILGGETLYEVKAGDRGFRAIDVRQVLTYLALNYASGERTISHACLVNPRTGVSFETSVPDLAYEISGMSAEDLLALIAYTASSGQISR